MRRISRLVSSSSINGHSVPVCQLIVLESGRQSGRLGVCTGWSFAGGLLLSLPWGIEDQPISSKNCPIQKEDIDANQPKGIRRKREGQEMMGEGGIQRRKLGDRGRQPGLLTFVSPFPTPIRRMSSLRHRRSPPSI